MAQLNQRELDVLNILWSSDEPMTAIDIVNKGHGLTQSTVTAVLRKLLNAGTVEVQGVTHSGKVLSRTYRPTESSKDIILDNFTEGYANFNDVVSESTVCAAIFKRTKNKKRAKQEINNLRAMLDEFEKNL